MTDAPEGLASLVSRTVDGRYRVDRFVARGGFGAVFRATHLALGRPVALKVLRVPEGLHGTAREDFLARFRDEARTLAALDHPALVRVTDFGALVLEGEEVPWMAMDWVDGQSLADELAARRGRGGRSPDEALALLRGAFDGVEAAHAAGVAHRDLKPSNLMVCAGAAGSTTRVLDFGIAKLMDGDERAGTGFTETRGDAPCFTPGYAAPEQISRARTGPWTDVHALALVLTEVLCDRSAYPDGDSTDAAAAAFDPQRPTPGHHGVDVGAWEPLLARALSLRPADRFADAGAFLRALEAARATPPVTRPPTRRAWIAGAVGLGFAVFVGARAWAPSTPGAPSTVIPTPIPVAPEAAPAGRVEVAPAPAPAAPAVDAGTDGLSGPRTPAARRPRRPVPAAVAPVPAAVSAPAAVAPAPAPSPPRVEIE